MNIEDQIRAKLKEAVADPQRAAEIVRSFSHNELASAELLMADGWRDRAGHAEDPSSSGDPSWDLCESCGRLDGQHPIAFAYHPAHRNALLATGSR